VGLERRVQAIAEELSRSREELSVVRAAAAENEARVAGASMRAEDRSTVLDAARSRRLAADSHAFQARRDATASDARLASLREDRAQTIATAEGARRQAIDAAERLDAARTRLGALARQGDEAQAEWLKVEAQITVLATKRQHAVDALEACVAREHSVRAARDQVHASLAEATHKRDRYRREQLELEDRERRLGQERETIQARMDERYQVDAGALLDHLLSASGITLAAPDEVRVDTEVAGRRFEAVEDMVVRPEMFQNAEVIKAMVTRVEEARAELGRIGEVNLTAFEEYNELRTRHDDLESQRTDLDESVASIRSAIAKMNKTCRERFRETFDRVNEAFRTAYPELVGGGEAKLMLTDEEDLLETGVEIMVRPPGKRLQTLSLLSGGEKAMTAIALLLALFTVKPSPFCVLDEVDAPLDEANGARFNDMLKRMASMTQFLVVTHNRKTMECADTLYGITMPAPGCSTLVSVKIDG
jgi:chromosome segregation protein